MATTQTTLIGPELQSLPLQQIIGAAMNGITSAQAISAKTTLEFLKQTTGSVNFSADVAGDTPGSTKKINVSVPELAVSPIPNLMVDSAEIHFNFEIKQFSTQSSSTDASGTLSLSPTGVLSNFISASLNGSVTHKSTSENTTNRSGMLDIDIKLSQQPIPSGLATVLSIMNSAITTQNSVVNTTYNAASTANTSTNTDSTTN